MDASPGLRIDLTHCLEERLPAFYHVALGILGRPAEAEDAVQDSALKAVRSLHTFRSEADMCTWMHRILLNRCNDHLAARGRDQEHLADEDVEDSGRIRPTASTRAGSSTSSRIANRSCSPWGAFVRRSGRWW
ncbi:MAG: RNA polymerase sigma factor [Candidatus Dormibacteria bacterium]